MSDGTFFCLFKRPSLLTSLPLARTRSQREVEQVIEPLYKRYSAEVEECLGSPVAGSSPELPPSLSSLQTHSTQRFVWPTGGLAVKPSLLCDTDTSALHNSPLVGHDEPHQRVVVFFGHLDNLSGHPYSPRQSQSPGCAPEYSPGSMHHVLERRSAAAAAAAAATAAAATAAAIACGPGSATTAALLRLYDAMEPGQELLLLSELQGSYAFVVFDGARKQVLAARDPTGSKQLFFARGKDEGLMFTNDVEDLPEDCRHENWQELPPGHYIAGKEPSLKQFALTMEQLQARKRCECHELMSCSFGSGLSFSGELATSPGTGLLRRISKRM
ncbi:hypothetical protein V8C86DRAFT_2776266 [Haematococcus lacustris]